MQIYDQQVRLVVVTVAFAIAILVCGVAAAQDQAENIQADAADTTPDTVAVEDVSADAKIAERLRKIYSASGWFEDVEVSSEDGFVTITGQADTDEHSTWAEEIARRTTDVIGVNNDLTVDSQVSFTHAMNVAGKSLSDLYRGFLMRLPFLVVGLGIIFLTWLAASIITTVVRKVLAGRSHIRSNLKDLLLKLTAIATWAVGLLIATVVIFPGMTPSKALAVLGLGSVAIGFAFKDIFENFFAGVLILWRYPVEKGDFIQYGDVLGKIEEINIRNTLLRKTDGELVIIPNGQLFKSNVEVLTDRDLRRVRIICGVGYEEDLAEARQVIQQAVESCSTVDTDESIQVFAKEFGDSSINFEIAWWAKPTPLGIRESRNEVVQAVKKRLDHAEIEIPFPYRTLTFAEPMQISSNGSHDLAMQN